MKQGGAGARAFPIANGMQYCTVLQFVAVLWRLRDVSVIGRTQV